MSRVCCVEGVRASPSNTVGGGSFDFGPATESNFVGNALISFLHEGFEILKIYETDSDQFSAHCQFELGNLNSLSSPRPRLPLPGRVHFQDDTFPNGSIARFTCINLVVLPGVFDVSSFFKLIY